MPWKINPDTKAFELDTNGNPVFVLDGGEEKSVDYAAMSSALAKASREAAERKDRIRNLEAVTKQFEGIEDIPAFLAKARKDAETVAALDDKQKSLEENTRARIEAAVAPLNTKIKELEALNTATKTQLNAALIDGQFGSSKYVSEELVNAAMAKELFAKNFSVNDEGKIVATGSDGRVVYDQDGPAGFESALRQLVAASPYKDFVLKGNRANGSGANPGGNSGGNGQGHKQMTRAEFDKLDPVTKAQRMRDGYTLVE